MTITFFRRIGLTAGVLASTCFMAAQDAPSRPKPQSNSVNQNSLIIQEFNQRLDDYVKLRKRVQSDLPDPKSAKSAAGNKQYQESLAQKIREQRPQAKPGDIFTPPASTLFRKLIADPLRSSHGGQIRASLRHAAPVQGLKLVVNQEYPQAAALQSTPPTLLLDLPKLPAELDYRIVGPDLILLDTAANLIVDILPHALPAEPSER